MAIGPDLSAAAFEQRKRESPAAPSPVARNYAAAWLSDGSVVTGRSRGRNLHAEVAVLRKASELPHRPRVEQLYTERQPCCECEAALSEAGVAPDSVTYSVEFFDMPGTRTPEDVMELARLNNGGFEQLRRMIREAEGSRPVRISDGPLSAEAQRIAETLRNAGLNTVSEPDLGAAPGFEIVVDDLDDDNRGLYLSWWVGADLNARVLDAMERDLLDDPSLAQAAAAKQDRLAELVRVLDRAGIRYAVLDDDAAPYTLTIVDRP